MFLELFLEGIFNETQFGSLKTLKLSAPQTALKLASAEDEKLAKTSSIKKFSSFFSLF